MKKIIFLLLFSISTFAQVGINTATPNAVLDVVSNNSGILIPRLTTLEVNSIPSPLISTILFNKTIGRFQYYDGVRWLNLKSQNYKSYIAVVSQSGTNSPTVSVLENTYTNPISIVYIGIGLYSVNITNNEFVQGQTTLLTGAYSESRISLTYGNSNQLWLKNKNLFSTAYQNDFNGISIEIKTYY